MTTPPVPSMTWAQALGWRAERQLLDPVGSVPVAEVVRRLGAVPAADPALAELGVRTRSTTSRAGDLARAVADGSVVTAFAYGGGVHHLAPEEGGAYLALRCAGRQWELPSWVEHYGLAAADWPDFRAAVREALGEESLTLAELGERLTALPAYRHLRPVFDDDATTLLKPLTWQGDVCLGPPRDRRLTLRRLDRNPRWAGLPPLDEAGPWAVAAYLRSHGPATPAHVHHRLGEGLSAGRKRLDAWLDGLRDELAAVDVEGTTAYVVAADLDGLRAARPSTAVRFLPGHDTWVMGPGTKDVHVTPAAHRAAVTRKANPVTHGGVVRGTWTRRGDELRVVWLDEQPPPDEALRQEVDRLAGVLDRDLRLDLSRTAAAGGR